MKKKAIVEDISIVHDESTIPAKIYQERRYNVRYSMGKKGAILRLPVHLSSSDKIRYTEQFIQWVRKQLDKRVDLAQQYQPKSYQTGDTLQVGPRTYELYVTQGDRKTHSAKVKGAVIELKLSEHQQGLALTKSIKTLLSRVIGQDFLPEITERVHAINQSHFQSNIKQIRLKYNRSNWGSCSSSGNINLSTRLLFAPQAVIDYVIIHELAHTKEMNHSKRFWSLVEGVMPSYKEKEKWLKQNSHLCDF